MFATLASGPASRWHADDGNAARAIALTTTSIIGIMVLALLTRPDLAVVKLAQAVVTESITIRIDDDLAAAAARRKGDAAPQHRAETSQTDATTVPTRPIDASTTPTDVGAPDGTASGTPDGTASGTPDGTASGTPDGTGTQTDGDGTIGSSEGDGSDEFMAVEHDPTFSLQVLYRALRYPDMARRAGIEGTVLVKVLVGTAGQVERIGVMSSDHDMLSNAALEAVRRLQFTPAQQNGAAVACWVRIPVRFELR